MVASDFEFRHQRLIHNLIVAVAVLTYLIQPDDIVWRFVKARPEPHVLERRIFIAATLFIAAGGAICTLARTKSGSAGRRRYFGDFVYAIGLGSLLPIAGFIVLVAGEGVRLLRLALRGDAVGTESGTRWGRAIRQEAVKWCLLVSMIVFVITLKDRVADILVAASFVIGLICNAPLFDRSSNATLAH